MNMKVYAMFLLTFWKKRKMKLFYKYEHKNKIKLSY